MGRTSTRRIDLNADLGEGRPAGQDRALMQVVSSASIACGGHAGDPESMRRSLETAKELGVRVGAHPSYPDREGFGRVSPAIQPHVLRSCLEGQVATLTAIAAGVGIEVSYLKPHGALYNDASRDPKLLAELLNLANGCGLPLMIGAATLKRLVVWEVEVGSGRTGPGSFRAVECIASLDGREIWRSAAGPRPAARPIAEAFIDRGYQTDGSPIPRDQPGALISDPEMAAEQALRLAPGSDTLCVHSDSPSALEMVHLARSRLEDAGWSIGW